LANGQGHLNSVAISKEGLGLLSDEFSELGIRGHGEIFPELEILIQEKIN